MIPLNVLLSHALLDLTRTCENAGAAEVVLWSNALRVVGDDGAARKAMPVLTRLSRRAVKTHVDALVRGGWAAIDDGIVRLCDPARDARNSWGAAIVDAEEAWRGTAMLRDPLEAAVSELGLEHPHYPCGYGAADWRITGGNGADWKPVPRSTSDDTVSRLSVLALLSQALVGFAVAYEERTESPLLVGVHFDAAFTDGDVALTNAPTALGITGTGKSALERHGLVALDHRKRVSLTPRGQRARDAYQHAVSAIEHSWSAAPALRRALEAVDLHDAGHADHPDVRFVSGLAGFAEASAGR